MHFSTVYAIFTYASFLVAPTIAFPAPDALAGAVPEAYPEAVAEALTAPNPEAFEHGNDLFARDKNPTTACVGDKSGNSAGQYTCIRVKWDSRTSIHVKLSIRDTKPIDNRSVYGYYVVIYKDGSRTKSKVLDANDGGNDIGDGRDWKGGKKIKGVRVWGCVKKSGKDTCKQDYVSNPYVAVN